MSVLGGNVFSGGTAIWQTATPSFLTTWSTMTTAATNTATLSTINCANLTANSVIQATISKDDQAGAGNCWLISSAPGAGTITYVVGSNTTASSQLQIATTIEKY